MVLGEDEYLGLAGQATERRRVQDAIAVTLEAGSPLVGLFGPRTFAGTCGARGSRREQRRFEFFALGAATRRDGLGAIRRGRAGGRTDPGVGVGVG
jgi:hypothetical protein